VAEAEQRAYFLFSHIIITRNISDARKRRKPAS